MKAGQDYEVVLKKKRGRYIPKKVLKHTKITVNDHYTFNASIWIADTPESNLKPTVNLVVQHNGDKMRLCFPDSASMCIAMKELTEFLDENMVMLHEKQTEAIQEFLDFHRKQMAPVINDYTVYTVIQDKRRGKVDLTTGELIEDEDNEPERPP